MLLQELLQARVRELVKVLEREEAKAKEKRTNHKFHMTPTRTKSPMAPHKDPLPLVPPHQKNPSTSVNPINYLN